jgi:hypothetical protein
MNKQIFLASLKFIASVVCLAVAAVAQGAPAKALPADPWPRVVDLSNAQVLVYQPQVSKWTDNQLDFRAALAIKPDGAKEETFGTIVATARTQVDKTLRFVTFENLRIAKVDFPTLPDHGAAYAAQLQTQFAKQVRTIALDRLEASLALAGIKPPAVAVQNNPPQVVVSYSPAILVPIDGAPVLKSVAGHPRAQRVINTRALILQDSGSGTFYIHVYDGWLQASAIGGPWTQGFIGPFVKSALDSIAQSLSASGMVDLLDGGKSANPKPSLANGVPTVYTSQVPTELILFKGQPDFVPVVGTQLLWAANTTSDTLIDTSNNNYYVLMAGRWFRAAALTGPWTFVPSDALPADFARIPPQSLAGAVLPTVAGTPQAQEAVISNSIPQTATVPLKNGPKFTPTFDGPPQYAPIEGTPLSYVVNASTPLIQVAPNAFYRGCRRLVHRDPNHGALGDRDCGAHGHLHDPAVVLDLLRHLREDLRSDAGIRLRGLHAGLLGHGGIALRHSRLRYRLCVQPVDRLGLVRAALYLRRVRGTHLQPVGRLYVWFRGGPGHGGMDGPVLGLGRRRLVRPRLLGRRLRVLRVGQRQRLRSLGQRSVRRYAQLVRGRRRGRIDVLRFLRHGARDHRQHQRRPAI